MLLEFLPGGDFFTLLTNKGALPERIVVLYVAEIALALHHLHQHGVVYRDLKPENVMLDAKGHVRLVDFGLSRCKIFHQQFKDSGMSSVESSTMISHSFCGTEQYMAPEELLRQGHNFAADWWSLGIILSELLTGRHPFRASTHLGTLKLIVNSDVGPSTIGLVSSRAASLMSGLLNKSPSLRLGNPAMGGFDAIKNHPFFMRDDGPINWNKVLRKEYSPGYVPTLTKEDDIQYFDSTFTSQNPRFLSSNLSKQ
jgi:serine/threonine protein kinase